MSFFRHGEIDRSDGGLGKVGSDHGSSPLPPIGLDEFPAGYSWAGCAPAVKYQTTGLDNQERNRCRERRVQLVF